MLVDADEPTSPSKMVPSCKKADEFCNGKSECCSLVCQVDATMSTKCVGNIPPPPAATSTVI
jgi:hypothetical protein